MGSFWPLRLYLPRFQYLLLVGTSILAYPVILKWTEAMNPSVHMGANRHVYMYTRSTSKINKDVLKFL